MTEPALQLQDISKRFGTFNAVEGLSFEVPAGSIYGFLGPNGAGKTTTIRMILEILKPTSGSITILGKPSALDVRHRIGYLPEEKGLYKKMKAWSTIAYFARLKGMDRKSAKKRAYELLERYGLADFADARTEALSKGMGQKVQVLASIAHDPDFVILDEPFSGLDPVNQGVMEELIKDMAARGRTTLFSTHVMQHAERICDRILLIAGGRKVFDGTIEEAKRTVPRRVRIESDDDVSVLASMDEVAGIHAIDEEGGAVDSAEASNGHAFWELHMRDDADPQSILQACYERGIRLRRFDHTDPTLHEVFVNLVGDEAREVKRR